jgi:cell division protein ZapA|tara:strand:+ start:1000 stop:1443 length:444 start_codon:yes stop_codon:yes gene_type:complete
MANVNIIFNGKEFLLSCEDGQEDHLKELSEKLNDKFNGFKNTLGNIGESKILLITSISLIDEYYEAKKNINEKKKELEKLTEKFKEIKSLIYQYRDEKEIEIKKLKNDQINLEKEIEKSQSYYERIIDNATNDIEEFLKKNSTNRSV